MIGHGHTEGRRFFLPWMPCQCQRESVNVRYGRALCCALTAQRATAYGVSRPCPSRCGAVRSLSDRSWGISAVLERDSGRRSDTELEGGAGRTEQGREAAFRRPPQSERNWRPGCLLAMQCDGPRGGGGGVAIRNTIPPLVTRGDNYQHGTWGLSVNSNTHGSYSGFDVYTGCIQEMGGNRGEKRVGGCTLSSESVRACDAQTGGGN